MKDRLVAKRFRNMALLFAVTIFTTVFTAAFHGRYLDEIVLLLLVDTIFFLLFWYVLEYHRLQKNIAGNRETSFRRILKGYTVSCGLIFVSSFLPEFGKPVFLVPVIIAGAGSPVIGLYAGVFLNLLLCLAAESTLWECVLYVFFALLGCMLAEGMEHRKLKDIWYAVSALAVCTMLPGSFYYLAYREVKPEPFFFGVAEGLISAAVLLFFYRRIALVKEHEIADILEDILEENYPLCRELRNFSKVDYNHARRVSRVAAACAKLVGADACICAAAGFYYRIGILEGEAIGENGVRIAQRECFPEVIIRIISEYNGTAALPSDLESAIVHMVDGLIKKIEVFDSETMSSEWNQDMVIYQTLNDFSAQGLYDKSGLSMNMFLKIREYLVNKEALL